MNKNIVKLSQEQIKNIILESVKSALKEGISTQDPYYSKVEWLTNNIDSEEIVDSIFSYLDVDTIHKIIDWFDNDGYLEGYYEVYGKEEQLNETGRYMGDYDRTGAPDDDDAYVDSLDYIIDSVINGNWSYAEERIAELKPREVSALITLAREYGYEDDIIRAIENSGISENKNLNEGIYGYPDGVDDIILLTENDAELWKLYETLAVALQKKKDLKGLELSVERLANSSWMKKWQQMAFRKFKHEQQQGFDPKISPSVFRNHFAERMVDQVNHGEYSLYAGTK